ncbi:MAG: glycoside hydrolase family 127 protein, partial [Ruminiclostridium sp.]|nr:glycoside hydrolase family 127 protein [Ruminiclostridium sp.]
TGDKKWKKRTEAFWKKAVTERGMYATTGNNSGEFWIPPMRQAQFLSQTDQEFCTVYNMVRLAAYLYDWTGESVYADYIERALYNGFLAQQSRMSGMPTYFLPMMPGSRKKWASKTHDFWCCLGTMVQAQTLYPSLIYRMDEERHEIRVGQYIPSEAVFSMDGVMVRLTQKSGMKNYSNQAFFDERGGGALSRWVIDLDVKVVGEAGWKLMLRVPSWCEGVPQLYADGKALSESTVKKMIADGYLTVPSADCGKALTIRFSSEPVFETLPDEPEKAAILSGPIVLAGLTEEAVTLTGKKAKKILKNRMTHTYSTFPWEQDHFETTGQKRNISLIPLYEVEDEAYTVYFDVNDN